MERNSKGQFIKGHTPHNKGKIGYTHSGSFKVGHKCFSPDSLNKWREGGGITWNKGNHIQLNTGRTHFKKGQRPHNYKGGISRTQEYHNFYNRKRKNNERNVDGSHTQQEWQDLKKKYGYMCLCCKKREPEITLSVDHIIPITKGGSDNIENIQPLCRSCNSRKWTRIVDYININQEKNAYNL